MIFKLPGTGKYIFKNFIAEDKSVQVCDISQMNLVVIALINIHYLYNILRYSVSVA